MSQPWIWLVITLLCLALCTFLPIWVKDPLVRKWMYWVILIPVSLVLIFYAYPLGIEVFKNLALTR